MTHTQEGAVIACRNVSKREREREGKRYEALYQGLMKGKSYELKRSGREGRSLDINSVREGSQKG